MLAPAEDLARLATHDWRPVAGDHLVLRAYGSREAPPQAARELFDALRALDATGVDEILALAPAPEGIGLAIHDRLLRAAEGRVITAAD